MSALAAAQVYADPAKLLDRVLQRTTITPGCWTWTGAQNGKGYGIVNSGRKGKSVLVHRLAVLVRDGSIDPTLTVDHTCHNVDTECPGGITCRHRLCVNPAHLDPVTVLINKRRAGHGAQTHCARDHELAGDNLYIHRHGQRPPTRGCRACRRERAAAA